LFTKVYSKKKTASPSSVFPKIFLFVPKSVFSEKGLPYFFFPYKERLQDEKGKNIQREGFEKRLPEFVPISVFQQLFNIRRTVQDFPSQLDMWDTSFITVVL